MRLAGENGPHENLTLVRVMCIISVGHDRGEDVVVEATLPKG